MAELSVCGESQCVAVCLACNRLIERIVATTPCKGVGIRRVGIGHTAGDGHQLRAIFNLATLLPCL